MKQNPLKGPSETTGLTVVCHAWTWPGQVLWYPRDCASSFDSKQHLPAKIWWMGSCQPLNIARPGDDPSSWETAKHTSQVTDPQWISMLYMKVCRNLCVDVLQGPGKQTLPPWPIWLEFKPNKRFFSVQDLNPSRWCHHLDRSQEVVLCEEWDHKKDLTIWTGLEEGLLCSLTLLEPVSRTKESHSPQIIQAIARSLAKHLTERQNLREGDK